METRRCVQCGQIFTISDSEKDFFIRKNLNLPKRCKACRDLNKGLKPSGSNSENSYYKSGSEYYMPPQHHTNRITKLKNQYCDLKKIILIVVLGSVFLMSSVSLIVSLFDKERDNAGYTADNTHSVTSTGYQRGYYTGDPTQSQNTSSDTISKQSSDTESTSGPSVNVTADQNAYYTDGQVQSNNAGSDTIAEQTAAAIITTDPPENVQSTTLPDPTTTTQQIISSQYSFRNSSTLSDHFAKHGGEFGYSSAEEYQEHAIAVINSPDALHKKEAEDGDDVYYLEKTNEIVFVSSSGIIRTYFKPDSGIDYYNKQ
ncbi:MAG: zinc-ribbon domain containing protein [Oscillospiraceae bacterium]|nr:zinc-ribbon domain containing protein [Oscillospiraceae bacterium]